MKAKKLFAGLLAAVMTASAVFMTGCSGGNSEENSANTTSTRKIMTLNMYIMTDEETDQEAARKVQMEINRILLPEYKTMLKINYIPEGEYWDTVEGVMDKVEKYKKTGVAVSDEAAEASEAAEGAEQEGQAQEEVLESDGAVKGTADMTFNELIDFIYDSEDITLTSPQLDIFVVNDYEKYKELALDGKLVAMDEYLSYDSSVLKQYIYPTFLSAARVGKSTYGIPTNHALENEFTYFVFNKNLLDKYGYKVSDFTTYTGLEKYLTAVKAGEPGVWPVSGACDIAGAEIYDDAFITTALQLDTVGSGIIPAMEEKAYRDHLTAVKEYAQKGFYPASYIDGARYAVEIVKTNELYENPEWTDKNGTTYAAYLYDVKRISGEEVFKSAMCISDLSRDKKRAMEIITLFNTDAELANLLQYGISGEHYHYNEDTESVTMLGNKYSMDTMNTGNIYIKYAQEGNEGYVEKAMASNITIAPSAFLGFELTFSSNDEKSDYEVIKTICLSAQDAVAEGRMKMDEAYKLVHSELFKLGYKYDSSGTSFEGPVFAKLASDHADQAKLISDNFALSEEVVNYNKFFAPEAEQAENAEESEVQETAETAEETQTSEQATQETTAE